MNIHTITISKETVKEAKRMKAICAACAAAAEAFHASETDQTVTGKRAMARLGGFIIASVASDTAKVPFNNLDGMLAYLNTSKQHASLRISLARGTASKGVNFMDACTLEAWYKLASDTVKACDTFTEVWRASKEASKEAVAA